MSAWKVQLARAIRPESYATLRSKGVSQGELRSGRWRRVCRGYYVPTSAGIITAGGTDKLSTTQRILDATPLLAPGTALGTWAAAYVLGVDWLDGLSPHTMAEEKIEIISPGVHRQSTKAVTYRWSELLPSEITTRNGVQVTSGVRTAFDGARWADSLEEAVVFIDSMAAFDCVTAAQVLAYAAVRAGWNGIEQAEHAATLSRAGVRSGWETRLRMCWRYDAGLPEPWINAPIFDRSRNLLGIADLFDPRSGLVAEFDGGQHRDAENHRRDNIREEKFESANLVVVRSDKTDVRRERRQLVHRLRDGYRRGQARDRTRDTWTLTQPAWWHQKSRVWKP